MGEMYASNSVLVQRYGKAWFLRRRLLHHAFTPTALQSYKAQQKTESIRLVFRVMQDPESWEKQFGRFMASVVFSISYGYRINSMDSPVIKQRLHLMQFMASLDVPGAYLAESFPILKHMPKFLAPWKKVIADTAAAEAATDIDNGTG